MKLTRPTLIRDGKDINMNATKKPAKSTATKAKSYEGFSDEEKGAMKERAKELKSNTDGESDLLAKIAEMPPAERAVAEKLHAIIKAAAPDLVSKTWYGMPAYAKPGKNGKLVCFYQPASKFKTRYGTLGFQDEAALDDGTMWPTAFAITTKLTAADEKRIAELIKKAVA